MLIRRDPTDAAVQEARLALPFAYSKLQVYGRAALLYGQALDSFGKELEKVDASTRSIRAGNFLKALVREEIKQDNVWVVRLRTLPDTPETFYLTELMASNDFQTALQNYLDMEDLRRRLIAWQNGFDAFEDLIRLRRANYEPLLPDVDAHFRELDSQMRVRLEQREHLQKRLQDILTAPRPALLATADERVALERLRKIETALKHASGPECAAQQARLQHLQGVLTWRMYTEYPERLTRAHKDLHELNEDVAVLQERYTGFVRARQAAVHSYAGYDQSIQRLRTRVGEALERVNTLLGRQGHVIEAVAIDELNTRRERLEAYQVQARYAVADSYDRALKEHVNGGTP
jgi:predicted  nucleic acid-binding Zn-ribbon protein